MDSPGPILNSELVDQWFASSPPDEQASDRKTANLLRTTVGPRIARLRTTITGMAAQDAERELHNLRGSVASFGFIACAAYLLALEHGWQKLPLDQRMAMLTAASETFDEGLVQLFARFPHLR